MRQRYILRSVLYCMICGTIYSSIAAGVIYEFKDSLPSFAKLEDVNPAQTTNIFSADGVELKKFWIQLRDPVMFDQLPKDAVDALVAIEDHRFWRHWGVSIPDIIRVALRNIYVNHSLSGHGASTVTQQLARHLFLTLDQTWQRKIKEQMTAVLLERTYTKSEIMTMYFNQMLFGRSAYGLKAAASRFFNKSIEELSLTESAYLVGLLQSPNLYSKQRNFDRSIERRDQVLGRMRELGKITQAEYSAARQERIIFRAPEEDAGLAPYFTEEIRKYLERTYGLDVLYDGATVHTTLDSRIQRIAEEELTRNLERVEDAVQANWKRNPPDANFWARIKTQKDTLENLVLQSALVALDPHTGHILAMVGGRDFEQSRFNRATQALRQPGSSFKPFIYTAAIDAGIPLTQKWPDTAVSIQMPDGTYWQPENYDRKYLGWMTMREGLAGSRNVVTTQVLQKVGPRKVVEYANKMGIESQIRPVLSLGMGTSEVRLIELVSAYGTLPNKGIHVEPMSVLKIVDKNGNLLEESVQGREQAVLSEEVAAVVVNLMQSVLDMRVGHDYAILNGTGMGARTAWGFRRPAGGKTGTTQNYADAWFVGYTSQIVCGVWVGFDSKVSMGSKMTGASVTMPLWAQFMKRAHAALNLPVEQFDMPATVPYAEVCGDTYEVASIYCPKKYTEVFVPGTEPKRPCPMHTSGAQSLPAPNESSRSQKKREFQF
ncbi:MAG: PBP1A family penicillin-binding protein [bacterium]|nr:PBP1A family penicillin-binding protein [bacterium]